MTFRPDRRVLAAAVLICWVVGIVVLAQRRHEISDADLLSRGALRLEPATYFYAVSQDSRPIGYASSAIDTTAGGFTSRDIVRARALIAGDSQSFTASATAYLTRGFALDSFALSVGGARAPFRMRGKPEPHYGVLLPSLAPIALMLMREPRVGATTQRWLFNAVARRVERVTLTIAAESLFRVVDSASFDSARRFWVAAHTDTIRAWKIATPSRAISAWVDSQGRIVSASEPGGTTLTRTAYEIATLNPKLQIK